MVRSMVVQVREGSLYIKPVPNVAVTQSFLASGICRLDKTGSGKTKIYRSEARLKAPAKSFILAVRSHLEDNQLSPGGGMHRTQLEIASAP